jgi:hypothetical protein
MNQNHSSKFTPVVRSTLIEKTENMIIDGENPNFKSTPTKLSFSSNIEGYNSHDERVEKSDIQSLFNRNKNPKKRERSLLSTSKDNIINPSSQTTNIIEYFDKRDPRQSMGKIINC